MPPSKRQRGKGNMGVGDISQNVILPHPYSQISPLGNLASGFALGNLTSAFFACLFLRFYLFI